MTYKDIYLKKSDRPIPCPILKGRCSVLVKGQELETADVDDDVNPNAICVWFQVVDYYRNLPDMIFVFQFKDDEWDQTQLIQEPLDWQGDNPPQNLTVQLARSMYWRRVNRFDRFEYVDCHICGGNNTGEFGTEELADGVKVAYTGCQDCEMVTGDC